ncbi:hypothetical protein BpHYR1_000233, partial [Brachionus plicatilis]
FLRNFTDFFRFLQVKNIEKKLLEKSIKSESLNDFSLTKTSQNEKILLICHACFILETGFYDLTYSKNLYVKLIYRHKHQQQHPTTTSNNNIQQQHPTTTSNKYDISKYEINANNKKVPIDKIA